LREQDKGDLADIMEAAVLSKGDDLADQELTTLRQENAQLKNAGKIAEYQETFRTSKKLEPAEMQEIMDLNWELYVSSWPKDKDNNPDLYAAEELGIKPKEIADTWEIWEGRKAKAALKAIQDGKKDPPEPPEELTPDKKTGGGGKKTPKTYEDVDPNITEKDFE